MFTVLRHIKKALSWNVTDLKGISQTYCMHKIKLKEEFNPVVQPQIILNPNMKEVVRKEVLELLEAGMIYHIFDMFWVSPVHVVPKKGGWTLFETKRTS